jgi:nucleotide-binding universal stress UspA family protein
VTYFQNILVGVDPLHAEELTATDFKTASAEAVRQGLGIAAKGPSQVTFLSVVDVPNADKYFIEPDRRHVVEHLEQAIRHTLDELVKLASAQGIEAHAELGHGAAWTEIVRRVGQAQHDLVIVARSDYDFAWRDLLGHTALKLVQHCPVPVWVAKPDTGQEELNILVASDLSDVGLHALQTAVALRSRMGGTIHLLNVLENPLAGLWETGLVPVSAAKVFKNALADARRTLAEQVAKCGDAQEVGQVEIDVLAGRRDPELLGFIQDRKITLLVIGTSARGRIARFVLGNSAERLLPYVHCSLLAVKGGGDVEVRG